MLKALKSHFKHCPLRLRFLNMFLVAAWLGGCQVESSEQDAQARTQSDHGDHGDYGDHDEAPVKSTLGPHRGRLLQDGPFAVELAIFEAGVPPVFRAWATLNGKAIPSGDVALSVVLTRLGNLQDTYQFKQTGTAPEDFLQAQSSVYEPHSFAYLVQAEYQGERHQWRYDSFEGRTTIPSEIARDGGVRTEIVGPQQLREAVTLYGQTSVNPEFQREVSARFPGAIRAIRKSLGEAVSAGETLALIESNESLRSYAITAPISGIVTARDANVGEQSADRVLFTISNVRAVVAELSVFPKDRARVIAGADVLIKLADSEVSVPGKILRIDRQAGSNQAVVARAALEDTNGQFLPGSFITGEVMVAERTAALAVRATGLQTFRDFTVVFAQEDDTYEVRMLELGARHGEWVEVLGGLDAGTRYVTENSYLIKADIEKSGAAHDH